MAFLKNPFCLLLTGQGEKGDGRHFVLHKLVMNMKCKLKSGIGANFLPETNTLASGSILLSQQGRAFG